MLRGSFKSIRSVTKFLRFTYEVVSYTSSFLYFSSYLLIHVHIVTCSLGFRVLMMVVDPSDEVVVSSL